MNKDISVLMSVYKNDIAKNVRTAVESVYNQTLKPKQIVMIVDGPVSDEINSVLAELEKEIDIFEVQRNETNLGLGKTLNKGANYCKYDFIARMDSDDISVPERFEKEMSYFEKDENLSVVGSFAQEFFEKIENLSNIRAVPETNEDIVNFIKKRCPFCHPSVVMKKEMLEKVGGYQDWFYAEDYYLWIRMYLAGAKFYNVQESLIYMRMNYDTYERRGGPKYYKSIKGLLKFMYKHKMMGFFSYTKAKIIRFVGHVLVPKKLKRRLYLKFLRKEKPKI